MIPESQHIDYKSIRTIQKGDSGFKDLVQAVVCFANAQGGRLVVGVEDADKTPPENQTIGTEDINKTINRLRSLSFNVGLTASDILTHANGGQYFEITVSPSVKTRDDLLIEIEATAIITRK